MQTTRQFFNFFFYSTKGLTSRRDDVITRTDSLLGFPFFFFLSVTVRSNTLINKVHQISHSTPRFWRKQRSNGRLDNESMTFAPNDQTISRMNTIPSSLSRTHNTVGSLAGGPNSDHKTSTPRGNREMTNQWGLRSQMSSFLSSEKCRREKEQLSRSLPKSRLDSKSMYSWTG